MSKTTLTTFIAVLALTMGNAAAATYTSVPAGGLWNAAATWDPAGVPVDGDDVILGSAVTITTDAACRDLTVLADGSLTNNLSHRNLTVTGNLVNDGVISDSNYQISLLVAGNVTNRGSLAIERVRFTGAGVLHSLIHEGAGDLLSDNLELEAGTGTLNLQGDLLTTALVDLNGGHLVCAPGADVFLTDSYFIDGTVDAAGNAFELTDGVYFQNVTIADPVFRGLTRLYLGCTLTGTVINEGELRNRAFTHVTATVDGDLINTGSVISDNYQLNLLISGDVDNQGVWDNNAVTFTGADAPHDLTSGDGTVFSPRYLVLEAGTGDLTLTTPAHLDSEVDLNAGRMACAPGANLDLSFGPFMDGELDAAGNAVDVTDGLYFQNLLIRDPVLRGVARTYVGCTLAGDVVLEGELRNRDFTHVETTVDGDLANHGTITSTNYRLTLFIAGDVINDGVWTNHRVVFTGAGVPHAYAQTAGKSLTLNNLDLEAGTGPLTLTTSMTVGGNVDLNGGQVLCAPGAHVHLTAGQLQDGGLDAAGNDLRLTVGTYLTALQVGDPVLRGDVQIYTGVTMTGTVVVQDTLRNRDFTHDTLIIDGDIANHGLITSSNYRLTLNVSGDAHNAGTWENYRTVFDGVDDQFILLDDAHPMGDEVIFVSHLASAPFAWTNGSEPVAGAAASNLAAGVLDASAYGQYRCHAADGESRWIFVSPEFDTTAAPDVAPLAYALEGNSPNPFNPKTSIAFSLPETQRVELAVHDLKGRRVRTLVDGTLSAGRHAVEWTGNDDADRQVAAGVYFSVLRSAQGTLTRKLTLLP